MLTSNITANAHDKEVKDFQLLLESPREQQLIAFANKISPNNEFSRNMDDLGVHLTKEKYTKDYHTTFSKKEIYQECNKYNLGFVSAKNFTGKFSIEFLDRLENFIKEKNIVVNDYELKNKLYVLAPRTYNLGKVTLKSDLKDPLFFYSIDDDYFVLLDGSKDYITLYNAWRGFKNKTEGRCRIAYSIENTIVGLILYFIISHLFKIDINIFVPLLLMTLVGFLTQFIRFGIRADNREQYSDKGWSKNQYPI